MLLWWWFLLLLHFLVMFVFMWRAGYGLGLADMQNMGNWAPIALVTRETLKRAFKRLNGTRLNTVRYGT